MNMMSYNTARNKLHKEMMFLNLNWADLEHMLQESPGAFPVSVIEAYKAYKGYVTAGLASENL